MHDRARFTHGLQWHIFGHGDPITFTKINFFLSNPFPLKALNQWPHMSSYACTVEVYDITRDTMLLVNAWAMIETQICGMTQLVSNLRGLKVVRVTKEVDLTLQFHLGWELEGTSWAGLAKCTKEVGVVDWLLWVGKSYKRSWHGSR